MKSRLSSFHINLSRLGLLRSRQLQGQDSMLEVRGNFGLIHFGEAASSELFLSKEKYAKKKAPDFAGALSDSRNQ
jgi:hypothetical protein